MNPLPAKTLKDLRDIAAAMPMVIQNTHEKHLYTQEELEEWGYVDAEKLPDGKYLYKYPVQIAINHYRALKKAWRKSGFNGCMAYVKKVKSLPNMQSI
ncbi:MAG TPA: hypothetical protein VN726_06415 [Hanamia sp.]|nr:hypothetical protein [Hanamia sp.]